MLSRSISRARIAKKEEKKLLAKIETGVPADYSFKFLRSLKDTPVPANRTSRVGSPETHPITKKYLTKAVWFNNNKLKNILYLNQILDDILERPQLVGWLDFSFNNIAAIDSCLLNCHNLRILYFHGNCISELEEVFKLRALKKLRNVTLHGNPISNLSIYRHYLVGLIPTLVNLDFSTVVDAEKTHPPPVELVRKLKEDLEGTD